MSVGVVGAGNWGKELVRTFHRLGELGAVAEANPGTRRSLEAQYPDIRVFADLEDMLEADIEGVVVATPAPTHYALGRSVLQSGKDLFVEKPLTLSSSESRALVELAEESGRILMVGHLLLHQPAIQWIRQCIESGGIGRLMSITQERMKLGRVRSAENVLWSFGVHDIAVMLYLMGEKPLRVRAMGRRMLQKGIEDDAQVSLEFSGDRGAHLHVSWLWPEQRRRLIAIGARGMLIYDEMTREVVLHNKYINERLVAVDEGSQVVFHGSDDPLSLECAHFLKCIRDRIVPLSSGRSAIDVVDVLERASAALEDGDP